MHTHFRIYASIMRARARACLCVYVAVCVCVWRRAACVQTTEIRQHAGEKCYLAVQRCKYLPTYVRIARAHTLRARAFGPELWSRVCVLSTCVYLARHPCVRYTEIYTW